MKCIWILPFFSLTCFFSVPKSNPGFYTALLSMSISFGLSAAFQSPEQSCRFGGERPYAKVSFHGFLSRIHGGPMALLVVSTSTTWSGSVVRVLLCKLLFPFLDSCLGESQRVWSTTLEEREIKSTF